MASQNDRIGIMLFCIIQYIILVYADVHQAVLVIFCLIAGCSVIYCGWPVWTYSFKKRQECNTKREEYLKNFD